jgi:hypothetical protein
MLRNRIGIFVNLPLPTLDRLAPQARLNEIGHNVPNTRDNPRISRNRPRCRR